MFLAILLLIVILVFVIPWLVAHAGIILTGMGLWLGAEITAPDRQEVAAQAALARTFDGQVRVSGERLDLDDRFIIATVHNDSNARIYDVWLRCSFQVPETRYKLSDPGVRQETISSDYHYGYIVPGSAERVSLKLEQHGLLGRTLPSSLACEPRYEHEVADLFKRQG
jgi:hypothetical protein